jgi:putative pyruvate formate lyase activating enzyme
LWFKDVALNIANITIFAIVFSSLIDYPLLSLLIMKQEELFSNDDIKILKDCTLCPRECRVDRFSDSLGYCKTDTGINIASVCIHRGEEPVISGKKGICNIFFSGCNLRCIYCQNHEISRPCVKTGKPEAGLSEILERIIAILLTGVKSVGFVSPSHMVPQVKLIINGLNSRGFNPIIVYNTNSYEKVETLKSLSGLIDVYLPDFKYVTSKVAEDLSDASDYPSVAIKALKEMYYQKGSGLRTDEDGNAESGMLIRHLVLPGYAEESRNALRTISEELSPGVHLSLMSQYHPTDYVKTHPRLKRVLYENEYKTVVEEMEKLGFRNGWVQGMDSYKSYLPDFSRKNPFE